MKIKVLFIGLFFLAFGMNSIQAQTAPIVKHKQIKQNKKINHGVKTGELTRKEAAGLKAQQVHINRTKKRAKADGKVTAKERAKIARKQKRANKNIYQQKHDAQQRF